jgi:hypothetical protein
MQRYIRSPRSSSLLAGVNVELLTLVSSYRSISTVTEALTVLRIDNCTKNKLQQESNSSLRSNDRFGQQLPMHQVQSNNINRIRSSSTTLIPAISLSRMEIRLAYLQAAKESHPDAATVDAETAKELLNEKFTKVTQAYEYLIRYYCNNNNTSSTDDSNNNWGISMEEEIEFNDSCLAVLGLRAEIVEESKQDPGFRQWLLGNTDSAHLWRGFLANHGGLAPKLRPKIMIESSTATSTSIDDGQQHKPRRRRRLTW